MPPSFKKLKQILSLDRTANRNSDEGPSVLPSHSSVQDEDPVSQEMSRTPIPVDESQAYDDPGFGIKVLVPGATPTIE
jgi:hypothetical protein